MSSLPMCYAAPRAGTSRCARREPGRGQAPPVPCTNRLLVRIFSTHIVEDIAQTCRNLAVLKNGRVVFQGGTIDLIGQARGKVWIVTTNGSRSSRPTGEITVVSTMHMDTSVQYRVVGEPVPSDESEAVTTEPSLEDSYVWLMRGENMASIAH